MALVAVVKKDCPTCQLVEPVLERLAAETDIVVYREDDDEGLRASLALAVETVPTLIDGEKRIVGWKRDVWETFTGIGGLGEGLPDYAPGCGARAVEPDIAARFAGEALRSRRIELADAEDDV